MRTTTKAGASSAPELIKGYIARHTDWRGRVLEQLRAIVLKAEPAVIERWKWGIPVFERSGNLVALGAFSDHVKLNFFQGASLKDPNRLFNAGLDAKGSRAIDIHEGDRIDAGGIRSLVNAAVAFNIAMTSKQ